MREAWRRGLAALDAEAQTRHRRRFHDLGRHRAGCDPHGCPAWRRKSQRMARSAAAKFLHKARIARHRKRLLRHPTAWNEIGFGGPASPRGYVRMNFDRRDPWEARKRDPDAKRARGGRTRVSADPTRRPRAADGRAPDVFRPGGWVPMRQYRDDEVVDFAIVGTGAGGGTLACKLAEYGFSVVALDAGPYWRPLEDFASDEHDQTKLYWTDERIVDGDDPLQLGANNSGKSVGGSTVHFAMVSLRFRPEWFKARTKLGYGADWPLDWREMWTYYGEVEQALKISGPVNYPWGPKRPRYPYRPHELNAAALVLARARSARHRLVADAAGDRLRAARPFAALRLSRHVHDRLLDQCQAERAGHLAAARARGRRRNPRSRHGRTRRARRCRARDRRALSSARAGGASSAPATSWSLVTRSKRRDCFSTLRPPGFPMACQLLRARRQESDGAVEPGRLGADGAGNPRL